MLNVSVSDKSKCSVVSGWERSCAEPGCCALGPDPEHVRVTSHPGALLRPTCPFRSVSGGTSFSETTGTIWAGLVSGNRKESGSASCQFPAVKIATWLGTFYTHKIMWVMRWNLSFVWASPCPPVWRCLAEITTWSSFPVWKFGENLSQNAKVRKDWGCCSAAEPLPRIS